MSLAAVLLPPDEREALALAAELEQAYRELRYFVVDAFKVLEPGRRLIWTWHLTVLCEELQAWLRPLWDPSLPDPAPHERLLVICVPPRSLKTIIKICTKAWLWVRQPWLAFNGFGNDEDLEENNNRRLMQLVTSPWYQQLIRYAHVRNGGSADDYLPWGIDPKQSKKHEFLNTAGGGSLAFGMDSNITGRGADLQDLDDPLDAKKATRGSPDQVAARMTQAVTDFDGVLASRYVNLPRFMRLLIMQRLDPGDPAGVLIRRGARCIVFPMEFDPDFPADHGGVHPRDPRTRPGELLMPDVVSQVEWDAMKETAANSVDGFRHLDAQYNQRTRAKEGGLFREEDFARRFQGDPLELEVDEIRIYVDCSFKKGTDTSHVVFQAWGKRGKATFFLLDQVRERMGFVDTVIRLVAFRLKWALRCKRVVLEDKANGPAVVDTLKSEIPGIMEWPPGKNSKYERAEAGSAPPLRAGQVYFPEDRYAPWMKAYIGRHVAFNGSGSVPDDEIDTTSMALLEMAGAAESPLDKLRKMANAVHALAS